MKSPFDKDTDLALFDYACRIPCIDETRIAPATPRLAFSIPALKTSWGFLLRFGACRLGYFLASFLMLPALAIGMVLAFVARGSRLLLNALGFFRAAKICSQAFYGFMAAWNRSNDFMEDMLFAFDAESYGSHCYMRLCALWTRSICGHAIPPGLFCPPPLLSTLAGDEICAAIEKSLASGWAGSRHWCAALMGAALGPEDFRTLDRHFKRSGLPADWRPEHGLPSYFELRLACGRLCEGLGKHFSECADQGRLIAAQGEKLRLENGLAANDAALPSKKPQRL